MAAFCARFWGTTNNQSLTTPSGSIAARERIESAVASWTATRNAVTSCVYCRRVAPAGVMNRVNDLRTDPQVASRGLSLRSPTADR